MKTQQAEESDGNVKSDYTWKGPVSYPRDLNSLLAWVNLFAIFRSRWTALGGRQRDLVLKASYFITFPDSHHRFTAFKLGAVIMDPLPTSPLVQC
jgi:hypothetical protein